MRRFEVCAAICFILAAIVYHIPALGEIASRHSAQGRRAPLCRITGKYGGSGSLVILAGTDRAVQMVGFSMADGRAFVGPADVTAWADGEAIITGHAVYQTGKAEYEVHAWIDGRFSVVLSRRDGRVVETIFDVGARSGRVAKLDPGFAAEIIGP